MLVAYCRLSRHCCNLAKGGCLLSRFHFTCCRCFLGHVACRNLPWQGLSKLPPPPLEVLAIPGGGGGLKKLKELITVK